MKFRHPEQKGRNVVRVLPIILFIISIPMVIHFLYGYFMSGEEEILRVVMPVIFLVYFGFRARHSLEWTFIRDDEEGEE